MSLVRVLDTLETDRLILRRSTVGEAAIYRQLWTERDPLVPLHRQVNSEGGPTTEDIAVQIRAGHGIRGQGFWRWAGVWEWNAASRRVLDKLGFREAGPGRTRLCLRP